MGPKSDAEGPQNSPPSGLVAPPTSEERKTPQLPVAEAAVSPDTATSKAMFLACSCRSTPETSQLISDDSGFISGISSPATALNTSTVCLFVCFFEKKTHCKAIFSPVLATK